MESLNKYDPMLKVPQEVSAAARIVARWVDTHMPGYHDIKIYGVGVRTFLSVQDMRRDVLPEIRISELACKHEWVEYVVDNAKSPADPSANYVWTKCIKCGEPQAASKSTSA